MTGIILSIAVIIAVAGLAGVGVLLLMVRTHEGFANFDLSAAHFGATHATPTSTSWLRLMTQLGGAVVLVPATIVFAAITGRRQAAWPSIVGFLLVCVGGQFAVANLIKASVQRARPDLAHLTGFSGSSFPSGHATAAAATFAAMALIAGRGRARSTRTVLGAVAVGLTAMVAASRVLLGVHWLTDSLAGMCLGWSWFALSSIAFGGRLLRYGASAEIARDAVHSVSDRTFEQPAKR
jgi:undecaprenyl-diphosphatase